MKLMFFSAYVQKLKQRYLLKNICILNLFVKTLFIKMDRKQECIICYNKTTNKLKCNHYVCNFCAKKIEKNNCPYTCPYKCIKKNNNISISNVYNHVLQEYIDILENEITNIILTTK